MRKIMTSNQIAKKTGFVSMQGHGFWVVEVNVGNDGKKLIKPLQYFIRRDDAEKGLLTA